jgi:hypothetical protein
MKVLNDGIIKVAILTEKPADTKSPTAVELNGGIDASCNILTSDFNWTNSSSATFDEKPLCATGQSTALGISQFDLAATFVREYLEAGGADVAGEDAAYQAVKVKGTTVWIYARETDKLSDEDWAAGDEIYLGGEVQSDAPTRVNNDGNLKRRIMFVPRKMHENIKVAGV